jgi:Kef-type K+ transport system membrane component KefB
MTRFLAVLSAVVASLVCALTGAFVLWSFKTTAGLVAGVALELLALAIALPTQLKRGTVELKDNATVIVPVVVDAMHGGERHTDPQ